MQFLKTLAWVALAVIVAVFATTNWRDVTIDLWGNLEADIKLPVLMIFCFLLGFLPPWLMLRSRRWTEQRRIGQDRARQVNPAPEPTMERPFP